MNKIDSTYDFKLDILKEVHPIKLILYIRKTNMHVENQDQVLSILSKVFNQKIHHTDVMNSFWTTYKYMLQFHYPLVFVHGNILSENNILENNDELVEKILKYPLSNDRAPFTTEKKFSTAGTDITSYYKNNFNSTSVQFKNQPSIELQVSENDTWLDFLINNFDKLKKVNEHKKLKEYASLVHTIGNITVVPKGFNTGRKSYDYWDYAMLYLYEFLNPLSNDVWKKFIKKYKLEGYVYLDTNNAKIPKNQNHPIRPFWQGHLNDPSKIEPKKIEEIEAFLEFIIPLIKKRGIEIMELYNKGFNSSNKI